MDVVKPRWASWSFLLYAGGLTVLGAAGSALSYFAGTYGDAAYVAWALLVFAAVAGVALVLRRDGSHPIAAGIFGFSSVALFAAVIAAFWKWFGWLDTSGSAFAGFGLGRLSLLLLTLIAALIALRTFRFPLIVSIVVFLTWFFVTDLVSGGGDWSAVVSFLAGLAFLAVGRSVDAGPSRPYGMWLHIGAGLAIGGSIIYFLHHSEFQWSLIVVGGVLFVLLADALERSSWAVLGAAGILAAAVHFSIKLTHVQLPLLGNSSSDTSRGWAPALVFTLAGIVLLLLGGALARRAAARRRLAA